MNTKRAVLTGAAGGIGSAVARRLFSEGYDLALCDIDGEKLNCLTDVLSRDDASRAVLATSMDATNEDEVDNFVSEVLCSGPAPDVFVSMIGIQGRTAPLWELSPDEWRNLISINLTSVFLMCRKLIPAMIEAGRGTIVLGSSQRGKDGAPGLSHYSASKGALISLGRSLAKEVASQNLVVHIVTPGPIGTGMGADGVGIPGMAEKLNVPMDRFGTGEEVAELVSVLASGRISFSTGYCWDLSGGKAVS